MDKNYLYCYKMTYDTGFAPNPEHNVLTLATCKPTIRRCASPGTWISGWTAVKVHPTENGHPIDFGKNEKLIYLAKISKSIPFAEYWNENKEKRPKKIGSERPSATKGCSGSKDDTNMYDCGDNIYEPVKGKCNEFIQHENGGGHGKEAIEHDLNGKNVLICEEFYYFSAKNAIEITNKGFDVPRCKKIPLEDERAKKIIEYVTNSYTNGINPQHL